jgi:hypothetical protein
LRPVIEERFGPISAGPKSVCPACIPAPLSLWVHACSTPGVWKSCCNRAATALVIRRLMVCLQT